MSANSTGVAEQHISTDRETIRNWADRHNAVPMRRSSDESLALVPRDKIGAEHRRLGWDTFCDELESENHAIFYDEEASEDPFEVLTHEQAVSRSEVETEQIRDRLIDGETVTSTVQETKVVETVVTEEARLESELVGRKIIDEELLDVELEKRTCTGFSIVSSDTVGDADTFDHGRYFDSLEASRTEHAQVGDQSAGERSLPYTATNKYQTQIDIREVWTASRKNTERFTVKSHITGTDVAGAETIEDYGVDVEGLHRSIVEQGMLDVQNNPDEVLREFEVESELEQGDQIHTHFTRTSVVEDKVIDQIRARGDIDHVEFAEMDFAPAEHVVSEEATETMSIEAERVSLTSDDIGKDVVDATGTDVGTVQKITDSGQTAYVEPHSSITERIVSALGWNDGEESEMEIYVGQFARVTQDEIRLKEYEHLAEHR